MRILLVLLLAPTVAMGTERFVCAGGPGGAPMPAPPVAAKRAGRIGSSRLAFRVKPSGTIRILAVFAKFQGEAPGQVAPPAWADSLFDPRRPGSLTHFYDEMSFGSLRVTGQVLPRRYVSSERGGAYLAAPGERRGRFGEFARQVLERVDADVDFGGFDDDGPDGVPNSGDDDGVVDFVSLHLLSTPRGFIVGGATGIAELGLDTDFESDDAAAAGGHIRISHRRGGGAVVREGGFAFTAGTLAHEFGHAMGLVDLYDQTYDGSDPATDSAGIGNWGLMGWGADGWHGDDGPTPLCAFSRFQLGWLSVANGRLVDVKADTAELHLRDLALGGAVARVPLPPASRSQSSVSEGYLLLEQRQRAASAYQRQQPADGLLVWHVQPRISANTDETAKRVDLVCADGTFADAGAPLGRHARPHDGGDNLDFWAHDAAYRNAHAGNLGDATDLFDGVRFTRLDSLSNPSGLPAVALAGATTGTGLRIRRQGDAAVVDVTLPRWHGVVAGQVRWQGDILVDGDLEVLPEGSLFVYPGTRVRFAATDGLRGGRDPERCELRLRGSFNVSVDLAHRYAGNVDDPATFAAATPGATWYGIVVEPVASASILVDPEALVLRDAAPGISMPGAPPGVTGLDIGAVEVVDDNTADRAGNGDGLLSPGETFALAVRVDNWSLSVYDKVSTTARWSPGQLNRYRSESSPGVMWVRGQAVHPGRGRILLLPSLTLSPEARPGDRVELTLTVRAAGQTFQRELSLPVHGNYPRHTARLRLAQPGLGDSTSLLAVGRPATVTALVDGDVAAVRLMVRDKASGEVLDETGMRRGARQGQATVFTSFYTAPVEGPLEFGLRVRGQAGQSVFSPLTVPLLALPDPRTHPVLVLLDGHVARDRKAISSRLQGAFSTAGLGVSVPNLYGVGNDQVAHLLSAYRDTGRSVIWAGGLLSAGRQVLLAQQVARGGRVLLVSALVHQSPGFIDHLGDLFGVAAVDRLSFGSLRVAQELAPGDGGTGRPLLHRVVVAAATGQPLVRDRQGDLAGVLGSSGRAGLIAFSLGQQSRAGHQASALLVSALAALGRAEDRGLTPPAPAGPMPPGPPEPPANPVAPPPPPVSLASFEPLNLPDTDRGNGAGLFDADGDGDLDIYLVRQDLPDHLLRNRGTDFVDATAAAGLGDAGAGRGLAVGDYDADGDLDLYLVRQGEANRLWANDGGRFREATRRVSVPGPGGLGDTGSGRSAAFFDADGDGDLDLYLVNADGVNRFYEHRGGLFLERAARRGLDDAGNGRGLAVGDIDGDGDTDLFLANTTGGSVVLRNDGDRFSPVRDPGLDLPDGDVAALLGDVDNDGDTDLFLANERSNNQLLLNQGDGRFAVQDTASWFAGASVGAAFGDLDNDGDLDLALTSLSAASGGDRLFENRLGAHFVPWPNVFGLATRSQGRGVVIADVDADGRQDLLVADRAGSRLYRNRLGEGHWLALELDSPGGNRNALGARVELRVGTEVQVREAQSGYGYGSQVQPRLHFGLGAARRVDELTVTWPDGLVRRWQDLAVDRLLALTPSLPGRRGKEVGDGGQGGATLALALLPAQPNPANGGTLLGYSAPAGQAVVLEVFDVLGQPLRRWALRGDGTSRRLWWDGRDETGRPVSSGLYLVRLRGDDGVRQGRLTLLK